MFLAEILSPHLVSSSGSGGGGVLGLRSNKGFFGFITDWSTVPDASAANILKAKTPIICIVQQIILGCIPHIGVVRDNAV